MVYRTGVKSRIKGVERPPMSYIGTSGGNFIITQGNEKKLIEKCTFFFFLREHLNLNQSLRK